MPLATIIGLAAALFTTSAFLPQVIRAWRTRSTRDLSLQSFATYAIGLTLWLIYGLMIGDIPLIASNGLTLLLALTLLGLKLRHG
ncbi:MAG TPA: SemiSWEET transporter [Caulobacteraceae bacterium]